MNCLLLPVFIEPIRAFCQLFSIRLNLQVSSLDISHIHQTSGDLNCLYSTQLPFWPVYKEVHIILALVEYRRLLLVNIQKLIFDQL